MTTRSLILMTAAMLCATVTMAHADKRKKPKEPVFSYDAEWAKADSLEDQNLPKSCMEVVQGIRSRAKTEHNNPQFIKAMTHTSRLYVALDEHYINTIFETYNNEIAEAQTPVKQILQSLLAESLNEYFSDNRWQIQQNNKTDGTLPENWTSGQFRTTINSLYDASLEQAGSLRAIPLSDYAAALFNSEHSIVISNLYELMLQRALNAGNASYNDDTEDDTYTAPDAALTFSYITDFTNHNFVSPSDPHQVYRTFRLYQAVLKEQLARNNIPGIIGYDLKRIQFASENSSNYNRDMMPAYWQYLLISYRQHPASNAVVAKMATGMLYNDKHERAKALAIVREALAIHPNASANNELKNIEQTILEKSLHITTENTAQPGGHNLLQISYANIPKIYLYTVKLDYESWSSGKDSIIIEKLIGYDNPGLQAPIIQALPNFGDYTEHTAEMMYSVGQPGFYAIVATNNPNWRGNDSAMITYTTYWSTALSAYIQPEGTQLTNDNPSRILTVLHAQTGKPVENAEVTVNMVSSHYNTQTQVYDITREAVERHRTQPDGSILFKYKETDYSSYYEFDIRHDGDRFCFPLRNNYYDNYYDPSRTYQDVPVTHLFMDRAIYRPGQTVYFKSITVDRHGKDQRALSGYAMTLELHDPNDQVIATLEGVSNVFGSYSDSFVLPKSGAVTGQYYISCNHTNNGYFTAEEYKRPKFEVTANPVTASYKLNDAITLSCIAKAFSGAPVSGAKVVYNVIREVRYPYYIWSRYMPMVSSPDKALANGILQTGDNGEFTITFKAVPDETINKTSNPYFDFRITATVTDLNGETHELSQTITLAYSDRQISLTTTPVQSSAVPVLLSIRSTNLQGNPIPHKGKIMAERLKPVTANKQRFWSMSDTMLMDRVTFKQAFPDMAYDETETERTTEALVWEQKLDNSTVTAIAPTQLLRAPNGDYRITFTSPDGMGGELKSEEIITLYAPVAGKAISNNVLDVTDLGKGSYQPGQTCKLLVSTSQKEAFVKYIVLTGNTVNTVQYLTLKQSSAIISIPVTEAQRGGFSVQFLAVQNYRAYNPEVTIAVPYTNKELKVSLTSFRNKLLPGQKDKWTVTISGSKAEKVAAEMMATLYDESLDQFAEHSWDFDLWPNNFNNSVFRDNLFNSVSGQYLQYVYTSSFPDGIDYDILPDFHPYFQGYGWGAGRGSSRGARAGVLRAGTWKDLEYYKDEADIAMPMADGISDGNKSYAFHFAASAPQAKDARLEAEKSNAVAPSPAPRKNFNETAFFYPQLRTDANGAISFEFTIPEALTRWKFMALAHTQNLATDILQQSIVTQKDLMTVPDIPRFLRIGDRISMTTKITNVSTKSLAGETWIELADAETGQPVTDVLSSASKLSFNVNAGNSSAASWSLNIPDTHRALTIRIMARSGNMTDGEEHTLPVLTDKVHITESMPLSIRQAGEKTFTFEHLKQQTSPTLVHDKVVVEVTSNPAWYAVQALPYMMQYPHECAEQTFNRYYANALATHLASSDENIQAVYNDWVKAANDPASQTLVSNLQKNEDLKSLALEETPWLTEGKNETERKKNLGKLFNTASMNEQLKGSLKRLEELQLDNGAWSWFGGMGEDLYITQYIVSGFGHLQQAGIDISAQVPMVEKAIAWMDIKSRERYETMKKQNTLSWYATDIQYLYARSYFSYMALGSDNKQAFDYWVAQAEKEWGTRSKHEQAMTALALSRLNAQSVVPVAILKSLKEFSQNTEEMGMYWKDNTAGWYWYQAPVETQALMIEAFNDIAHDKQAVTDLQVWLLRNKQSNDWKTTKATADACYALLNSGNNMLSQSAPVTVSVGGQTIKADNVEAGTGYFRTDIPKEQITAQTAEIKLQSIENKLSYGAVHWQYFEQTDKVTAANTNLNVVKKIFRVVNSSSGPKLEEVTPGTILHVGDKLTVRLTLTSDRDMEYVHLKDMRGSGTEPVSVLSRYTYQNGLSYYESTRDAATNFFIDHLYKGTYTLEYTIMVQQKGVYSNGIATVQCMYAPEYNAHSSSMTLTVE